MPTNSLRLSFPATTPFSCLASVDADGLGVAAAAFGLLNPLLAAFIHVGSELAFILNSTRLLPRESAAGQAGMGPLRDVALGGPVPPSLH